jgi:hypothetical protein
MTIEKKKINSLDHLNKVIKNDENISYFKAGGKNSIPQIQNLIFIFDITFPFNFDELDKFIRLFKSNGIIIKNCEFKNDIYFKDNILNYHFVECKFNHISADNKTFGGKMRFHSCKFQKTFKLDNTVFNDLVDFWDTTFMMKVIFYKVDFEKTIVFSISTFKDNVLFTYSKISEHAIFRGTIIEKGIDFSLAIIEGNLAIFDFIISDFPTKNGKLYKKQYENLVSKVGVIPQKNKRETFRIIKNQLIDQKNTIDASKFSFLESKTFRKEVWKRIIPPIISEETKTEWKGHEETSNHNFLRKFKKWLDACINYAILFLNRWSNRHGSSYVFGIFYTLTIGALFYYLSITSTTKYDIVYTYDIAYTFDWSIIKENVAGYVQFLIPIHRFNYLDDFLAGHKLNPSFYVWDILGRIFIGYGIYQTIQAFRKYR